MAKTRVTKASGPTTSRRSQLESAGEAFVRQSLSPKRTKKAPRTAPSQPKPASWGPKSRQSLSVDSAVDSDSTDVEVEVDRAESGQGEREYDVEKILDCRIKKEYLVKWTGFKAKTWEPESNLEHCQKALADYHKNSKRKV